jgi:hypothetical protein
MLGAHLSNLAAAAAVAEPTSNKRKAERMSYSSGEKLENMTSRGVEGRG